MQMNAMTKSGTHFATIIRRAARIISSLLAVKMATAWDRRNCQGVRKRKGLRMSLTKKEFTLVVLTFSVLVTLSCTNSCRQSSPDGLRFVNPAESQHTGSPLVVVTHGWIEKGAGDWPEDMARAICRCADAKNWRCGYFDWSKGAATVNPTDAARYARDVAGPKLAQQIIENSTDLQHIHLIAHSSGCWAISEVAKIIAQKTNADIHLTFLDAYIPPFWGPSSLGDVKRAPGADFWAEHYYTRDYTGPWTEHDLKFAHNVDLTEIDFAIKDHNFPWQWYYATIAGKFPKGLWSGREPARTIDGLEYGFARSLEASGESGWEQSLRLPPGGNAVKITDTK